MFMFKALLIPFQTHVKMYIIPIVADFTDEMLPWLRPHPLRVTDLKNNTEGLSFSGHSFPLTSVVDDGSLLLPWQEVNSLTDGITPSQPFANIKIQSRQSHPSSISDLIGVVLPPVPLSLPATKAQLYDTK